MVQRLREESLSETIAVLAALFVARAAGVLLNAAPPF
jgi:hypothetical protein